MTNEELVKQIKNGIDVADNMLKLYEQNKPFIYSIAMHYRGKAELEDLEQECFIALYDAVNGFKQEYGYKFLTYAEKCLKQRMMRYVQSNGMIRIPEHESLKLLEYKKLVNAFNVRFGREPTLREIELNIDISINSVTALLKAYRMARIESIDSNLSEDGEGTTIGDMIANDMDIEADVLEDVQREQLKAVLWPLVDALPGNQGQVLRQRFQENRTLKETGESMGVTIERVRQLEAKALRSLGHSRKTKILKEFCDGDVYSMGIAGTGASRFNSTWTSATERAALMIHGDI